eukprot:7056245-Prymnesium_polylepis.1
MPVCAALVAACVLHGRGRGAGHFGRVGHVDRVCWPHYVNVHVTRFGGGSEPSRGTRYGSTPL